MVGHGSILAFDERTDMRALACHLLEFGADESCGKCFPCRIGLRRGLEMVERPGPVDRDRLEALLETLELGSLCAHGGGMPAPIRSLIAHFPDELGVGGEPSRPSPTGPTTRTCAARPSPSEDGEERRLVKVTIDGSEVEVEPGHHDPRGRAGRRALRAHPLLRRTHGSVRRLPSLHGRGGGRSRAAGLLYHALPRRHGGGHRGRDLAAHSRGHGGARDVGAAARDRASTPSWRTSRGISPSRSRAGRASSASRPTTSATRTWSSSTSCASHAGAACARATRSRVPLRSPPQAAALPPGSRPGWTRASPIPPACPAGPAPIPAPPMP